MPFYGPFSSFPSFCLLFAERKRSRSVQLAASPLAVVAVVEDVLAEERAEPERTKKVHVPLSVIESVKKKLNLPSFCESGVKSNVGWHLLGDFLENGGDGVDEIAHLKAELAKLREERDLLKLRSVESTMLRNANFEAEFGIDKETFDWVLSVVEKDLPGSANVEDPPIFSPEGEKRRARVLGAAPEEVLGIVCRRLCKREEFAHIASGLGFSESWAEKVFHRAAKVLADPNKNFAKEFLRPQRADDVWKYTKAHDYDLIEFLEKHLPDFNIENVYYVVRIDGTHFLTLNSRDFFLQLLSHSNKKDACTLLTVAASVSTREFAFFSDLFGGRTSEPAVCAATDLLEKIVSHARETGAHYVVALVDKGFDFVAKAAGTEGFEDLLVCIPIRAQGFKQLSEENAIFVRAIGKARQPVEYDFGFLKRKFEILQPSYFKLGGSGMKHLSDNAVRVHNQVVSCFGLYNALRRHANPKITGSRQNVEEFCLLESPATCDDIKLPKLSKLSSWQSMMLASLPQITKEFLEKTFDGHFRDSKAGVAATNLLAKGSSLVLSHRVLGCRLKLDDKSNCLWVVGVCLSSFRRFIYHQSIEIYIDGDKIQLRQQYCTCFVGRGLCIHKAAFILSFAKMQKVPLSSIRGKEGLKLASSSELDTFSRDWIRDNLNWIELSKFYQTSPVRLIVHPNPLEERTLADVLERLEHLRYLRLFGKKSRGVPTLGDRLSGAKKEYLREEMLRSGIDIDGALREAEDSGIATTKEWMRHVILEKMSDMGDDDALYQLEVLDCCPCDGAGDDSDNKSIMCPKCRQWWHLVCSRHVGKAKNFKQCPKCDELESAIKQRKRDGTLGFWSNDFDDHYQE